MIDYKKIGLKSGIECHQQLATKKLFCSCDSKLIDAIVNSVILNAKEKMNFLKYIGYMTLSERKELLTLV